MQFFRKQLNSRFSKAIIIVIILTFIVWGIGDILHQKDENWLIKVGNTHYSYKDWQEVYRVIVNDPMSARDAEQNPAHVRRRVAEEMVKNALILQEAEDMGFVVSEEMVKSEVGHMKMFAGKDNKFDKKLLEDTLKRNNMTEAAFVQKMQQQMLRNQFLDFFYNTSSIMGNQLYDMLLRMMFAEQNLDLYCVEQIKTDIQYNDDNLKEYMKKNSEAFTTDEERSISTITFSSDHFIDENITPTEAEIEKVYQDDASGMTEPEKRLVHQIVISSYNDAVQVLEKIKSGEITYERAANIYAKNQLIPYEIGPFPIDGFDSDIGKKIFALKEGEITDLIQTPVGWHIFLVVKIMPSKQKDISEVRDTLSMKIINAKIASKMNEIMTRVADEIDQSNAMEEISKKYNLPISHALKKMHRNSDGSIDFSDRKYQADEIIVLKRIFSNNSIASDDMQSDDNKLQIIPLSDNKSFILLCVDSVKKGISKNFNDIKKAVEIAYKRDVENDYTNAITHQLRNRMMTQSKSNVDVNDKDENAVMQLLKTIKPVNMRFSRVKDNNAMPECIKKHILDAHKLGRFDGFTAVCDNNNKYYFAELKKVDFSVIDNMSEEEKMSFRQSVYSIYHDILFNELLAYLKQKHHVQFSEKFQRYVDGY